MLIGLNGLARVGKDTVYGFIKEDFEGPGVNVIRDAFADRLKISAARALGLDKETPEQCIEAMNALKGCGSIETIIEHGPDDYQEIRISGRQYLQYYGTEAHRDVFAQDFWVSAVLPEIWEDNYGREDLTRNDILVITDVRFPNEAEQVLNCGGSIWHIKRKGFEPGDAHASEQPLAPELITLTIENNTTLDALRSKVHHCVWMELSQQAFTS